MLKFIPLLALRRSWPCRCRCWLRTPESVLRIIEAQDQIVRIQAKTRHTTVIVLPAVGGHS